MGRIFKKVVDFLPKKMNFLLKMNFESKKRIFYPKRRMLNKTAKSLKNGFQIQKDEFFYQKRQILNQKC